MSAEPVRFIGPVQDEDYLVTSDVSGYAMAARNPAFGVVIAQALESFDGERWIRAPAGSVTRRLLGVTDLQRAWAMPALPPGL